MTTEDGEPMGIQEHVCKGDLPIVRGNMFGTLGKREKRLFDGGKQDTFSVFFIRIFIIRNFMTIITRIYLLLLLLLAFLGDVTLVILIGFRPLGFCLICSSV